MVALWPPAGCVSRALLTLGPAVAAAFVATAFVGTPVACWFGIVALVKAAGISGGFALAVCVSCALLGMAAELLKLALATQLGQLGRRCTTVVLGLWASCVAYLSLMPVLLLAQLPVWSAGAGVFVACAGGWAFIQAASGLAPAVHWVTPIQHATVHHPSASVDDAAPEPQLDSEGGATEHGRTRVDDGGWFEVLRNLAGQPGSRMGGRVRIGQDREIVGSQGNLARMLGLSKATLNRRLRQFAQQGRLGLETHDGITRIRMP
jgi:hypothetical protein